MGGGVTDTPTVKPPLFSSFEDVLRDAKAKSQGSTMSTAIARTAEAQLPNFVIPQNIALLVDKVHAALKEDDALRSELHKSVAEIRSLKASLATSLNGGVLPDASALRHASTTLPDNFGTLPTSSVPNLQATSSPARRVLGSSESSVVSSPSVNPTKVAYDDARDERIYDLEQVVQNLTERLRHFELQGPSKRLDEDDTLEMARNKAKLGMVYDKATVEKERLTELLRHERQRVQELQTQLDHKMKTAADENDVLQKSKIKLEGQLDAAQKKAQELQLENMVLVTHKDSLVNALKHERSLLNYAIALLEKHELDASQLKQMQQQFTVDTAGGTFVTAAQSVPPSLAVDDITPRKPLTPSARLQLLAAEQSRRSTPDPSPSPGLRGGRLSRGSPDPSRAAGKGPR